MDKTKSVEIQLSKILNEYDENVRALVKKTCESVAKETAKDVKNNAEAVVGNGPYSRSWKATETKGGWIVHNEKHYQLTHLLENGHAIANQFGEYGGRVAAYRHIGPAEMRGAIRFEEEITKGVNNL